MAAMRQRETERPSARIMKVYDTLEVRSLLTTFAFLQGHSKHDCGQNIVCLLEEYKYSDNITILI